MKKATCGELSRTIILFTLLVCSSCGSTKVATQTVRESSVDTVYLSNIQYDSVYVYQDRFLDRSKDTVYQKEVSVEYRYKLLRDTVRIIRCDSIPYEVTIVETKEITRPLTWFDHLSRVCFWLLVGILGYYLIRLIRKNRIL